MILFNNTKTFTNLYIYLIQNGMKDNDLIKEDQIYNNTDIIFYTYTDSINTLKSKLYQLNYIELVSILYNICIITKLKEIDYILIYLLENPKKIKKITKLINKIIHPRSYDIEFNNYYYIRKKCLEYYLYL